MMTMISMVMMMVNMLNEHHIDHHDVAATWVGAFSFIIPTSLEVFIIEMISMVMMTVMIKMFIDIMVLMISQGDNQ